VTPEDWEELLSESPGGENHGRSRVDGAWHGLDNSAGSALEEHYKYIVHVPIHGTRTAYNDGCRCKSCKRAERDYRRKLRSMSTSGSLGEPNQKEG
jgi:hypothetical protein